MSCIGDFKPHSNNLPWQGPESPSVSVNVEHVGCGDRCACGFAHIGAVLRCAGLAPDQLEDRHRRAAR